MKAAFGLALIVTLVACEKSPSSAGAAPQAAGGAPAPSPVPTPSASAPTASVAEPLATPSASPLSAASAAGSASPAATTLGENEARTVISGCLASSEGMPDKSAAPLRSAAGGPAVEIVSAVKPKVIHRLAHACCLRARTSVERRDTNITIVEELSGNACRCQCSSTLSTELTLPPGKYDLLVQTVQGETKNEAFHGELLVPASNAPRVPRAIHVPAAAH